MGLTVVATFSTSAPKAAAATPGTVATTVTPAPPRSATQSLTADAAVATLAQYVKLINAQDYVGAYALLSAGAQQRLGSEPLWAQGIAGSFYANPHVLKITDLGTGTFVVELAFTSTQPGQTCKSWDLDYTMIPAVGGTYRIDKALPHNGGSGFTPC